MEGHSRLQEMLFKLMPAILSEEALVHHAVSCTTVFFPEKHILLAGTPFINMV